MFSKTLKNTLLIKEHSSVLKYNLEIQEHSSTFGDAYESWSGESSIPSYRGNANSCYTHIIDFAKNISIVTLTFFTKS